MDDPFDPTYDPYKKRRHSSFSVVPFNATQVQLVGASQKRVGLVLSSHSATELQYAPGQGFGGHGAINIPAQAGPIILDEAIVGDIVKKAWFVFPTVAGSTQVGVIEIMTD